MSFTRITSHKLCINHLLTKLRPLLGISCRSEEKYYVNWVTDFRLGAFHLPFTPCGRPITHDKGENYLRQEDSHFPSDTTGSTRWAIGSAEVPGHIPFQSRQIHLLDPESLQPFSGNGKSTIKPKRCAKFPKPETKKHFRIASIFVLFGRIRPVAPIQIRPALYICSLHARTAPNRPI